MTHQTTDQGDAPIRRPWIKPVLLLAVVITMMVLAAMLDLGRHLKDLQDWIKGFGLWGPVVFVALYAAATVLALPGSALSALAGGIFGSLVGIATVSAGSTLGAALAFLVARHLARGSLERWLAGNEKFQRLDHLAERQGAVVVAITRLVPLFPFNLLNYGFGLTRVSFGTYVFFSWLCMLPWTILYVVGFDALFTVLSEGKVPWSLIAVVVVTALVLVWLIRRAQGRLARQPHAAAAPVPRGCS